MTATNPPVHPADSEDASIELYRRLCDAMVAADTAAIDALLTEDCVLTHMTGYPQPKVEWLSDIREGTLAYHASQFVSAETGTSDGFPVVRGRSRTEATVWGVRGTWNLQILGYVVPDSAAGTARNPTGWRFRRLDASRF
ncbi:MULTISPECIES: nuclear transport factor 2 family protein [unclassified Actinomyces]|uniref:nuclear transport factor 2 family protein n=1 Tax=unclassified Actinomyces TaxID=2609248 RepID=UPI0013A6D784|nr:MULTISPECIES: nuclear transport factor 2 family protein [unclassified Actinomyces]MBW3068311.1 nuclear transport factor 2 family protein [Actinomyces sp. 594]NDR53684.1 nuclear transport factor 2 family protein [Actinomyces sp. 565]